MDGTTTVWGVVCWLGYNSQGCSSDKENDGGFCCGLPLEYCVLLGKEQNSSDGPIIPRKILAIEKWWAASQRETAFAWIAIRICRGESTGSAQMLA